jgi:acetyl esterase
MEEFGDRGSGEVEKSVVDFVANREKSWLHWLRSSPFSPLHYLSIFTGYSVSKLTTIAVGLPWDEQTRQVNRGWHNRFVKATSAKQSFPKFVTDAKYCRGCMSKDVKIPSCTKSVTNTGRLYVPEELTSSAGDKSIPLMIYIHGGGWTILDARWLAYDRLCQEFSRRLGCSVLSLNYRMAPEHPYPYPTEDCYAALAWLGSNDSLEHVPSSIDRERIVVCGDSAGGNLTAALSLMYRDRRPKGVKIKLQVPVYPCFFKRPLTTSRTHPYFTYATLLSQSMMRQFELMYKPVDMTDEAFSKLPYVCCETAGLDQPGLPPTVGIVAGQDILRDEGVSFFRALENAGQIVEYRQWDNASHGFFNNPTSQDRQDAVSYIVQRVAGVLKIDLERRKKSAGGSSSVVLKAKL